MSRQEADAYERAVASNSADLHSYLARRLLDPSDAQDALSDVFLTAWRRRSALPDDAVEARMWLFGIAHNVVRNLARGRTRRRAAAERLRDSDRRSSSSTEQGFLDDVHEVLREAISQLPEGQRELVRLHHWEGFSLREAASILGVSASAARSRYATARQTLRAKLEAAAIEPVTAVRAVPSHPAGRVRD